MSAFVLSNYMSIGQETAPGVFTDTTGDSPGVSGALSMEDAALLASSAYGFASPQGQFFEIKVVYADQSSPALQPVFEIMVASYELNTGVYTWTRERTIASSNNGAPVTFQSGFDLKIFGVTSHEQYVRNADPRIVAINDTQISLGGLVSSITSSTLQDASDSLVIPSVSPTAILKATLTASVRTATVSTTANRCRGRIALAYGDTGSRVDPPSVIFGPFYVAIGNENSSFHGEDMSVTIKQTYSAANKTGNDWILTPRMLAQDPDVSVRGFIFNIDYEQWDT